MRPRYVEVHIDGLGSFNVENAEVEIRLKSHSTVRSMEYWVLRGLLEEWCHTAEGYGLGPGRYRGGLKWAIVLLGLGLVWFSV